MPEQPALWVKVSAHLDDDPRLIEAGPLAELVWLRLLRVAKRLASDGVVSAGHLRRATADLPGQLISAGPDPLDALQDVGLLRKIDSTHYELAGWLDWNRSRAELAERTSRPSDRSRRYRARQAVADQALELADQYATAYSTHHGGAPPPPSWNAQPYAADLLLAEVEPQTIATLLTAAARENKHPRNLEHLLADYQRDLAAAR